MGSNTLTFEEYVDLRCLAFVMFVTSIGIVYDPILKLLREYDYDVFDLFYLMHKRISESPIGVKSVYEGVKNSSQDELWNSPKEILEFYQNNENYQKLLDGRSGINVIQYHNALITSDHMDEWTEYLINTAKLITSNRQTDDEFQIEFNDVCNYSRGLCHNVMGKDRMKSNPSFKFYFDIPKWLSDTGKSCLNEFVFQKPEIFKFVLTDEQFSLVEDELNIYGNNPVGKAQSLKRIPIHKLWRYPSKIL